MEATKQVIGKLLNKPNAFGGTFAFPQPHKAKQNAKELPIQCSKKRTKRATADNIVLAKYKIKYKVDLIFSIS